MPIHTNISYYYTTYAYYSCSLINFVTDYPHTNPNDV